MRETTGRVPTESSRLQFAHTHYLGAFGRKPIGKRPLSWLSPTTPSSATCRRRGCHSNSDLPDKLLDPLEHLPPLLCGHFRSLVT